jgi:CDP-glycerol glycerophosphotransferase
VVRASAGRHELGLVLEGRTFDTLGKIAAAGDDWSITLALWLRGENTRVSVPIHVISRGRDSIAWTATVRGSDVVRLASSVSWNFRVETTIRQHYSTTPLIWHPGIVPVSVAMSAVSALAYGQRAQVGPSPEGQARLVIKSGPGARRRAVNRLHKRTLPGLERKAAEPWSKLWDDSVKGRVYAGLRRLPLDRRLVVFETNMGTAYGDSPKYVYEEMRRSHPDMKAVWVLPERHAAPAPDVEVVQPGTLPYLRALARAAYWVDNQTFPSYVRKRPGQRYLQTWRGIPLNRMGRDKIGTALPEQQPDHGLGAWDELVVPCPYFERVFVPAFDYAGGLVRYGTPGNDALVDGSLTSEQARRELDLPLDARVVLYAPTFREDNRDRTVQVVPPFDPAELVDGLGGDNTYVLLRPHYLNRIQVPPEARYRTLDVSRIDDVNLLYHAADVLITDYSSVMFDFALLRKPMVFYTYDYAEYMSTHGIYVDLKEVAPGPFVTTTAELVEALRRTDIDQASYAAAYSTFLEEYCGHEDGKASRRAVERLLNHGEDLT